MLTQQKPYILKACYGYCHEESLTEDANSVVQQESSRTCIQKTTGSNPSSGYPNYFFFHFLQTIPTMTLSSNFF
jgi:hypothetical protein